MSGPINMEQKQAMSQLPLRTLGDIAASSAVVAGSWVTAASHAASLLIPILTAIGLVFGLAWWILRFRDRIKYGPAAVRRARPDLNDDD